MEQTDLLKPRPLSVEASKLVQAAEAASGVAVSWVPHAAVRIREAAILKARLVDHMTWDEISQLPDVQMSVSSCHQAYYRAVNRFAAAKDIPQFINNHLRRYELYREMSINRALTQPEETHDAVRTALAVDKREARLLGLDAPERVEISGRDGQPIQFEETSVVSDALIARVQQLELEETQSPSTSSTAGVGAGEPSNASEHVTDPSTDELQLASLAPLQSNVVPLRPVARSARATPIRVIDDDL